MVAFGLRRGEAAETPGAAETQDQASGHPVVERLIDTIAQVILGKGDCIRLALAAVLARGHVLIEDVPGVGKTTLAHAMARALGLNFQRIQFTADLLPADVLGVSVYDQTNGGFEFHPGPIFAHVVLADEINRATPKTQSALLEAMEEHQVTQDRVTRKLPEPFFVLATQNPSNQVGTFALPESQLDRFLVRLELGYPHRAAERELLRGEHRRSLLETLPKVTDADQLARMQDEARSVHLSDALLDYVQGLLAFSREASEFTGGLSPRAGLALIAASRAWAYLDGRSHVLPEDVQAVLPGVAGHRLHLTEAHGGFSKRAAADIVDALVRQVPIP
jgi:MoxR-like ATPase